MRPVLKLRKTWVAEKVCQAWSTHSAEASSVSEGDGASWPSHIPISPSFIHHCAIRIPPPPAPLFSQSLEQTKEHMAISFSLSSYYFFSWGELSKNPCHSPCPAIPGPEAAGGALISTRGHGPAGVGTSQQVYPTPPSFSEVLEGKGKTQAWICSGGDEHSCRRQVLARGGGQSQTEINANKWLPNSLGVRICRALQLSCSHGSWAALKGGHPSDPQLCPQTGKRQWHSSCHQQRWEKHGFGVQIIVPHIPLFAIVISAVVLLDKQTSEKMQWAVRIDLHRADNWTFNLFTSPNRYLGWHLLINGIIRCLICSSQKLITQPMVKP